MFKSLNTLLSGYHFNGWKDLAESQFPSIRYHAGILLVVVSGLAAQMEFTFGFKMYTLVAFIIAALLELVSGIYASVVIRKEPFESSKFGRWGLKFVILMMGLYIIHQFGRQWIGSNALISSTFQWIYAFLFTEGALEYVLSIFENYAVITGKPKDFYVKTIQDKVNAIFGIPSNQNPK